MLGEPVNSLGVQWALNSDIIKFSLSQNPGWEEEVNSVRLRSEMTETNTQRNNLQKHILFLTIYRSQDNKQNLLISLGEYCTIISLLSFMEIKKTFSKVIYIVCRERGEVTYVFLNIVQIMFPFCLISYIFSPSHLQLNSRWNKKRGKCWSTDQENHSLLAQVSHMYCF